MRLKTSFYQLPVVSQSCGKIVYADKKAVISQLNRLMKKRGRRGRPEYLRAYYCDVCKGWHLTKNEIWWAE